MKDRKEDFIKWYFTYKYMYIFLYIDKTGCIYMQNGKSNNTRWVRINVF